MGLRGCGRVWFRPGSRFLDVCGYMTTFVLSSGGRRSPSETLTHAAEEKKIAGPRLTAKAACGNGSTCTLLHKKGHAS